MAPVTLFNRKMAASKSCISKITILSQVYIFISLACKNCFQRAWALKSPWKLKSCGIPLKSPWIFLKASWIKMTFVKKRFLCKGRIERRAVHTFSWWSWKYVFLWFQCSRHGSFSVIWRTLGTVPSWGKVLQWAEFPPPTNLKGVYFMSFYVKLKGKEVFRPWKVLKYLHPVSILI